MEIEKNRDGITVVSKTPWETPKVIELKEVLSTEHTVIIGGDGGSGAASLTTVS